MPKKIRFIINPVSGISNKQRLQELISESLKGRLIEPEILYTQYAGHGRELAQEALTQTLDALVVVGGDGSVNEAASALVGSNIPLGIIPAGSGNGLAHHLKLPFNLSRSLDVIGRLNTRNIDTYTVNGSFGCNVAGVGFDGFVAEKFSRVKRRGFWSYFRIVLDEYPRYKARVYTLEYKGQTISRKALLVSFANSNQFGNGAVIAPGASLDDGLLDVCIMSKVPLLEAPFLGQMLIFKLINRTHYVEYIKTSEIVLRTSKPVSCHIDGDPFAQVSQFHVKVNPLSLKIIVP